MQERNVRIKVESNKPAGMATLTYTYTMQCDYEDNKSQTEWEEQIEWQELDMDRIAHKLHIVQNKSNVLAF